MVRDEKLDQLGQFKPKLNDPHGLLRWLESVVVVVDDVPADVTTIRIELGRESIAYHRALRELDALWKSLVDNAEANLKRDLWNRLFRIAYGGDIEAPSLFLQHTYLTIVAKAIATVALLDRLPPDGAALLEGKAFRDRGIVGAVESDFFDWPLLHASGRDLVMRIARHANRFRLHDIEVDVLKGLYESLIDPEQRHDLGEYYTPDWLAERICETAIRDPLSERVIDPACGSGTFLFHAIRRLISAANEASLAPADSVVRAVERVAGIDIHPVAVIFARVTYLLALMPTLQSGRPGSVSIPVYLGDSLQWNAREFMSERDLEIVVPGEGKDDKAVILRFPLRVAEQPGRFDATLDEMLNLAERNQPVSALRGWLARQKIEHAPDVDMLTETYTNLSELLNHGRNHIWGYVARNLSRPIWLATEAQKADVVIGNPPWLDYRAMNGATQVRFKEEMKASGLWEPKVPGSAFDLSAYYFARSVFLYMRKTGRIAFVMPYAAMTRKSYGLFRRGAFKVGGYVEAQVQFSDAWAFPSDVQPLFPVPSCVLFAERCEIPEPLPKSIVIFSGNLPRRDADRDEVRKSLTTRDDAWPAISSTAPTSRYGSKFRAGAKLDPRRLILVERVKLGRLGANPIAPLVRGRTGALDKKPWKDVEPPQAAVDSEFLRPVYLGESIAPYRLFEPVLGVIPWDDGAGELLTAERASRRGYSRLASWLAETERLWEEHGKKNTSFGEKINFFGLLSFQFPIRAPRVVYSKSGTNPAAAIVRSETAIIDHKLYWVHVVHESEARYLAAILNSETGRARAERYQSQGQWGARDFDKVIFNLPIPLFDAKLGLHGDLAAAAEHAEEVAVTVPLKVGEHFTRARKRIRDALRADGVAGEIDKLVRTLLERG